MGGEKPPTRRVSDFFLCYWSWYFHVERETRKDKRHLFDLGFSQHSWQSLWGKPKRPWRESFQPADVVSVMTKKKVLWIPSWAVIIWGRAWPCPAFLVCVKERVFLLAGAGFNDQRVNFSLQLNQIQPTFSNPWKGCHLGYTAWSCSAEDDPRCVLDPFGLGHRL